ncbi:CoA transferase [Corynebacterium hylobatis]|uniref:CoA transferase n=1 Tax=Corynebacterium hylobatis TaxID=1859290 RepID=A0A3S0BG38_9CORY|nr:CaiB/BaiF CoA-transferase family protein [Corynebacterium hylobatis]RSZ63177.1 CoA transferase [Corynebacterium hylobatis]
MTQNQQDTSNMPLDGIRVLELGNYIAAPFASRIFGDFGADVIKIEKPGGDELRDWRRPVGDISMLFRTVGRNKRSVVLDLRTGAGIDAVKRLIAASDVIIENFRPGTIEKWGIGPDVIAGLNSDAVLVRISGYGQTGPYRNRAGFGSAAESFGGLRYVTGEADRPAARAAASMADTVAGLYGALGALMLMLQRARGRHSDARVVDVGLYEGVFSLLESLVPEYDAYGMVRQRSGGKLPGVVPMGAYPCSDDLEIVIGGNASSVFKRLMNVIGRPDLAEDESLVTAEGRQAREEELNDLITAWTRSVPLKEAQKLLDAAGVPAGPVYDAPGIAEDEHYQARGMVEEHLVQVETDAEPRPVRFPGVVPKIPGAEGSTRWLGPELGEHTLEVLRDVAGLDEDAARALADSTTDALVKG